MYLTMIDTVFISTAQRWFQRFSSGAEVIEDAARSGRPVVENCDKIAELIKETVIVAAVASAKSWA